MRRRPAIIAAIFVALAIGGVIGVLFERSIGLESVLFALGMENLLETGKELRIEQGGIPADRLAEAYIGILDGP